MRNLSAFYIAIAFLLYPALAPGADPPAEPTATPVAESEREDTAPDDGADDNTASQPVEMIRIVGDPEDLARIGGSVHVVDEEKLEEQEHNDIHRILRQVPGVYAREEDGFGLRPNIGIRGASSERSAKVTLMEDGILFAPAPYSAPAAYYFPLTTRMIAVEVFKGPASIQYGPHTVGGAINLVTRPIPDEPTTAVDVLYGQRDTFKWHAWAGGRYKGLGLLVEGVHLESDGFKDLDGGGDTGFTRNETMLKADYQWPLISALNLVTELKLGYSDELSNETYLGLSDDDFDRTPYRRYAASQRGKMDWDRWQLQLSQHAEITPDLRFSLAAYRNTLDRSWRKLNSFEDGAPSLRDIFADPTGVNAVFLSVLRGDSDSTVPLETLLVGTNARDFVAQGLQLVGNWDLATGPLYHGVEGGLRLHHDKIERDHTENPYEMLNGRMERTQAATRQIADNTGEAMALAVYLRDEVEWGRVTLTPGVRLESIWTDYLDSLPTRMGLPARSQSDNQFVAIPGIGGVVEIIESLSLLGGVHRGFSPVAPGQSGSADPEESINYEAGFRYAGTMVSGLAVGFYNDYQNLLATCRQGTGCEPEQVDDQFNGGAVDVYGLELLVDTTPRLFWEIEAPLSLCYTFTQSDFRDSFDSASAVFGEVEKGDELPYVPEQQVTLSVGLRRGGLGTTTTLAYVGDMRDVAGKGSIPANEKIDGHFVIDLVAYWDFSERGRLYLGIDNVADNAYMVSRRPFGARPGMPFQVMGGLKYTLRG